MSLSPSALSGVVLNPAADLSDDGGKLGGLAANRLLGTAAGGIDSAAESDSLGPSRRSCAGHRSAIASRCSAALSRWACLRRPCRTASGHNSRPGPIGPCRAGALVRALNGRHRDCLSFGAGHCVSRGRVRLPNHRSGSATFSTSRCARVYQCWRGSSECCCQTEADDKLMRLPGTGLPRTGSVRPKPAATPAVPIHLSKSVRALRLLGLPAGAVAAVGQTRRDGANPRGLRFRDRT